MEKKWKRGFNSIKRIMEGAITLLFPYRCPFCDEPNGRMEAAVCQKCKDKMPSSGGMVYEKGAALYPYQEVASAIYRFKYRNRREYAGAFAGEICQYLGEYIRAWNADGMIPVPLHKKRKRKRGYNQAELLAREIGKGLNIPVYGDLIIRCKNTLPQKNLNALQRQNNLKKAFKIARNDVKLGTIILVDDIYTTGKTVDEISGVLLEAGVKRVYFLTLATGTG